MWSMHIPSIELSRACNKWSSVRKCWHKHKQLNGWWQSRSWHTTSLVRHAQPVETARHEDTADSYDCREPIHRPALSHKIYKRYKKEKHLALQKKTQFFDTLLQYAQVNLFYFLEVASQRSQPNNYLFLFVSVFLTLWFLSEIHSNHI